MIMIRRLLLAVLLTAFGASAAPLVSQPLDTAFDGEISNNAPAGTLGQVADEFFISSLTALGTVNWYGSYDSDIGALDPTSFSIRIFSDTGGSPEILPFITVSASVSPTTVGSSNSAGAPFFNYSANLGGAIVGAGTYWISIVETDASSSASSWQWAEATSSGPRARRTGDGDGWALENDQDMAFEIEMAAAPEPSTWLLLGTGIVLAGLRRRRR
jgi:hypothetical protein